MKKNSLLLSLLLVISMGAAAQDVAVLLPGKVTCKNDSSFQKSESIYNINIWAVRDFVRRFKEPVNTRWYSLPGEGFVATFEQPDITCHVAYTKGGQWIYTIRYYHEKQLPHDIRHMVKSTYYDFSITGVDEVEHRNQTGILYLIHLEDDAGYITLRVHEGEMDIIAHFAKVRRKP